MTPDEQKPTSLHDWHRDVFTKRTTVTLKHQPFKTLFGGTFPQNPDGSPLEESEVTLGTARAVICQRVVNGLTPDEWKHAQAAFDASPEGEALQKSWAEAFRAEHPAPKEGEPELEVPPVDAGVRREHCELWLLHKLFTAEHPELVPSSELALVKVLDHHAHPKKIAAHKERLVAHVKHGTPLEPKP